MLLMVMLLIARYLPLPKRFVAEAKIWDLRQNVKG